ncbi:MAG TPA: PQQ-binding-like beta-propeller repeat protein [Bryobacteraceae bacterium]|nr:PQQ-binding-like beta-propeller repeat protein [Bryobacteraceae bacterium]
MKVLLLIVCTAVVAAAENWPQFRGPGASGLAVGKVPTEFTPGSKAQVWKTPVPFGQSSPSIWGDRIFLTSGTRDAKELTVAAFDRRNGKQLWQRSIPVRSTEKTHEMGSPATGTVAADADRIYVYFASAGLFSFSHDGKDLWSLPLPTPGKWNGSGTSPVLAGHTVLLNRDDPEEAYLLAVDRSTGKQVWKQSYGDPLRRPGVSNTSTPLVVGNEVLVHRSNELVALDAATGVRRWNVNVNSTGVSTPVVAGDLVFVSTWNNVGEPELRKELPTWETLIGGDADADGKLAVTELPKVFEMAQRPGLDLASAQLNLPAGVILGAADRDKDGKLSKEEFNAFIGGIRAMSVRDHGLIAVRRGEKGDLTSTNIIWQHSRNIGEVPTPLVVNNRVYIVTNGGVVTCNDAKTGKVLYRGRLGAPGGYYASPIMVDGHIYFSSGDGVITVVREGDTLEVVSRNDLQEPIHATPAVVNNTMYVRTAGHLYAFRNPAR